ncbi:MAG TPA: MFS transporter [Acidimicrobiales bacterium]|nr:MFS transporter [Acidimicrobiales bacterium]
MGERAIALAFTARFTDEVLSGAWTVLAPTFRVVFGLSLVQVGLLAQVVEWVALLVEPVTAAMIDLWSRRRLISGGALALAVSLAAMAGAGSYGWLLVAFAAYGVGSGPLCHTADIVVVESFPAAPERAYARATFLDTAGAFFGPGLIAGALALHVSWRPVLLALAGGAALYAALASVTEFPPPPRVRHPDRRLVAEVASGLRAAVAHPGVRRALTVLLCFDLFESAFVLKYIWLHDQVGLSLPVVALWATVEQGVDLVALGLLDRWLGRRPAATAFRMAASALVVLPAAWVLAPGVAGRVMLGIPLAFARILIWPLAKADSLTADAELAGAAQAVTALFPVIPFALLQSRFAEALGIGPALAVTGAIGAAAMLVASREGRRGRGGPARRARRLRRPGSPRGGPARRSRE